MEASAAVNPAGGAATIAVRNHYTSPLVAFVFIYTLRDAEATVYSASNGNYDSAIDPQQSQPVPPGGEVKIPYYAGNRGMIPVANIEAALFADGTTFGHKDMVQTLFERRNYALVTINKMVAELKQAARNSLTRDQLIAQMQTAMNDERAAAGNNDLALLILTMRNQVFADLLNARDPSNGAFLSMDKFLPAEIESLTRRKEALAPAGAK
ncbi:MAG TPA: hypothetical protein VGS58_15155 [Candidatus Sulfopaludibacter sp.]|nr:hypothetical protein [Candidatus Sulfopaludibacter sp.]